ncbi:mitotic spindle checkpoint protein BUBR1 [Cucumis melo var. makuwa]|uniref:Mitotic spindle checkpoint protein BUBR1 n=1 Tax=Cucumis melo var. makuwa TaxID=1194695 RepID=A0A5D3D8L2_CUCMM|nr:mitotic spindle checkpoint protein BUBR1 [Cucumis melo var. makuwa]
MEDPRIKELDPETEFLCSKRKTQNDWELFKENVKPLKRGRNITILNNALKSHTDNHIKKSLLENRRFSPFSISSTSTVLVPSSLSVLRYSFRKLIEAIDDYKGDDPLQPWLECIKWVQEAYPAGGDFSGLVLIYEHCVRTFWHSDRYKEDLRYLKVWLEYAENCFDAEVIFNFLHANAIGTTHSAYYISYALHLESNAKIKAANDTFNLGISRNAQPIDKLKDVYRMFLTRSMQRPKAAEESMEKCLPVRSFGTVLSNPEHHRPPTMGNFQPSRKNMKAERPYLAPLDVYDDSKVVSTSHLEPDASKTHSNSWTILGSRRERNKENNALPSKWTSNKIPQRIGSRVGGASASAPLEVFVDEECEKPAHNLEHNEGGKSSTTHLRQVDGRNYKRETDLLRQNPLRNFPSNSFR